MAVEKGASERASLESRSCPPAVTSGTPAQGPVLHPGLSPGIASRLDTAIPVALQHLRDNPSCRALVASFGVDGEAKLNSSSYYPAGARHRRRHCRRGSLAVTTVGSSAVGLCPRFARLSDKRAAIILIHEALHFAGQTEYPSDSRATDGRGITKMVMKSCRLF